MGADDTGCGLGWSGGAVMSCVTILEVYGSGKDAGSAGGSVSVKLKQPGIIVTVVEGNAFPLWSMLETGHCPDVGFTLWM